MSLTRKTKRRRRTTPDSTSSDGAASSLLPKDPLALGQHLVRELGLSDSTDTLGRWLAHEIAEAMTAVAQASTARQRATARREAIHLITTLWEHRDKLPGRTYPIAPFREILAAISLFTEDESRVWWGYRRKDPAEAMVFRAFSKLMPCLLLLHAPDVDEVPGPGSAAYEHLEQDERAILDAVRDWLRLCTPPRSDAVPRPRVEIVRADDRDDDRGTTESEDEDQQSDDPEAALRATALEAVALLERGLATIRARLEAPGAAPSEDSADDDIDRA